MKPEQRPEHPTANPEAVAWYLERAEGLFDDMRDRVGALRARGGQLAGFSGAVITLVGTNADGILEGLDGPARESAGIALLLGMATLISAFVVALRGAQLAYVVTELSEAEIVNYTTDRFVREADLWRVQIRVLRAMLASIGLATHQRDRAGEAIASAGKLFLVGLFSVGVALFILISVRTF